MRPTHWGRRHLRVAAAQLVPKPLPGAPPPLLRVLRPPVGAHLVSWAALLLAARVQAARTCHFQAEKSA